MRMKVAIRGYCDKKLVFEEFADLNPQSSIEQLVASHVERLAHCVSHMIEIEFLDEPDPNERFFRFGTDPSGMVLPIPIPWKN